MTGLEHSALQKQNEKRYGDNHELGYLPENFTDIVTELPHLIESRLLKYFPNAQKDTCLITEFSVPHSSYPIFAFQVNAGTVIKKIYVKFAPIYSEKNEGLVEYENLRHIDERFKKKQGYGSPRPLEFIREFNALVMEGVEGIAFRKVLLRDNRLGASQVHRSALKKIVERCGLWLRDFHRINSIERVSIETRFKTSLQLAWQRLKPSIRDTRLAVELQGIIDRRSGMQTIPTSRKHGDLALDNILVEEQRVSVLDVSYEDRDVIYRDIAFFMTNLKTINNLPRYLFYDFSFARQLCGDFLSAYGHSKFEGDNATLQFYLIEAVLERFESQENTIKIKFGAGLSNLLVTRLYKKYARILGEIIEDHP